MRRKEIILDNCPIHNCQPLTYEKDGELLGYDISPYDRNGYLWKNDRWYVMQQLFPAAQIFDIGYTVFCPECAKKSPFSPNIHNKFGYGLCSQFSLNTAKRNWNNACMRYYARCINRDLQQIAK